MHMQCTLSFCLDFYLLLNDLKHTFTVIQVILNSANQATVRCNIHSRSHVESEHNLSDIGMRRLFYHGLTVQFAVTYIFYS